jgi:hypothetical protein
MIEGCNFTFNIWRPCWELDLEFFLYDETNGKFVRVIFRLLKGDRGQFNIGKYSNVVLRIGQYVK